MRKLLDVTDRKTRLLQLGCILGCWLLAGLGLGTLLGGSLPPAAGWGIIVLALILLVLTASIRQRWEIEYRGHRIRFENSAVLAERLYLDEGLVARGGVGKKIELRAPIRVGEGAGEEIVVLADAGFQSFRLRIFVETEDLESPASARVVEPRPSSAPSQGYPAAFTDLRPVVESAALGRVMVAKQILEFIAALIGVLGGLSAAVAWLF